MKNKALLYLILCLFISSYNDIDAQNCTYIYRNDGHINAFYNDNIDSLRYSKTDINGVLKETWVTQEIFTPDSIYRIPLWTIDSIGFITPETIYRPGVIKLEDGLMPYITKCDSLTLYLAPSVPEKILPHKGDRLVTLNMTEVLPIGFAGKVVDLRKSDGEHIIECELTPLNDIFEQYYGTTESLVEPQNESRAIIPNPDPHHIRKFKISSQLSGNFGAVAGISDVGIGLNHSAGITVTGDLHVQTFLIVRPFHPTLFSTTIIADINTENKFETAIKGYASHDFGPDIKANLPCAPLIQVFMSNGMYLRFEGEIVAKRSYSQNNKFIFHYEHNGNNEAVIPPLMEFVRGDIQDEHTEVYGSAVFGLGVYSEVGLGIFDKNIANVTVRGEAGVEIEANAEIVKEEEAPSTKIYDALNHDDIISARLVSNSSISVKALCFEGGFNTGIAFEPYQLGKWGLVPEFIQPSFAKSPDNQSSIIATTTVGRKCLVPTKVGYAIYDKNNSRIDSWENPTSYNNELFTMSHKFENLRSNNDYTVYPYVKLFGKEYLASPNSKVELTVNVKTGEASVIKANSAILTGRIEGVSPQDDYTCGFYWSSNSPVDTENGTFVIGIINNDGSFSAKLDNLQPETTYYYRACATVNGETILADNGQTFTTEKGKVIDVDVSGLELWITQHSVFFIFPNITTREQAKCINIVISSDAEQNTDHWIYGYNLHQIKECNMLNFTDGYKYENAYHYDPSALHPLKPSTTYTYKIYRYYTDDDALSQKVPIDSIIGSFTTSSGISLTTPDIRINPSNLVIGEGGKVYEAHLRFPSPIVTGINQEFYNALGHAHNGNYNMGIIFSNSPDNLNSIYNDNNHHASWHDGKEDNFTPGTYYYRAYYIDRNNSIIFDENRNQILLGPDGQELGPYNEESIKKLNEISTVFGEIKEFTIPVKSDSY